MINRFYDLNLIMFPLRESLKKGTIMAGNNEMDLPNCQQGLIILLAGDLKTKLKVLPNGILTVMIVSRLMTTTLLLYCFYNKHVYSNLWL